MKKILTIVSFLAALGGLYWLLGSLTSKPEYPSDFI